MPSSVRLTKSEIVTATRVKEDQETSRIDIYASTDNAGYMVAAVSKAIGTGAFSGNPPSLVLLRDGRLAITYGPERRHSASAPASVKIRAAPGRTKSFFGATQPLGITAIQASVQRPDGNIVTVYYFPEQPQTERIIAATIWDPGNK